MNGTQSSWDTIPSPPPLGQAFRFRRICSEDRQFQERVGELAGWLKDRGYEESLVNEQLDLSKSSFLFKDDLGKSNEQ